MDGASGRSQLFSQVLSQRKGTKELEFFKKLLPGEKLPCRTRRNTAARSLAALSGSTTGRNDKEWGPQCQNCGHSKPMARWLASWNLASSTQA